MKQVEKLTQFPLRESRQAVVSRVAPEPGFTLLLLSSSAPDEITFSETAMSCKAQSHVPSLALPRLSLYKMWFFQLDSLQTPGFRSSQGLPSPEWWAKINHDPPVVSLSTPVPPPSPCQCGALSSHHRTFTSAFPDQTSHLLGNTGCMSLPLPLGGDSFPLHSQ